MPRFSLNRKEWQDFQIKDVPGRSKAKRSEDKELKKLQGHVMKGLERNHSEEFIVYSQGRDTRPKRFSHTQACFLSPLKAVSPFELFP